MQHKIIFLLLLISSFNLPATENIFLRLNPTIHTEMINRMDISGNLLATASDDKTVRLWKLPQGRLTKILRPSIAPGNEGKLFAVALSPDGTLAATGGWTKGDYRGFGNHNIYIFDTATGEIIKRLVGIGQIILHLDFSPDGKYLAATLSGESGLRIWRLSNMTEIFRDLEYAGDSYWTEFSSNGKLLVTTAYDGYIRLYIHTGRIKKIKLYKKIKVGNENTPFAARFSPDGRKIAVGFVGASRIAVLRTKDLSLQYWANIDKKGTGDLFTTAWSQDGKLLYAAGGYRNGAMQHVLQWNEKKKLKKWQATWNTVMDLRTFADNQTLYAASTPSLGMFDAQGHILFKYPRETIYFNKLFPNKLLLSKDAQIIQFEHDTLEQQTTLRFSLTEGHLSPQKEIIVPPIPIIKKKLTVAEVQTYLIKKGFSHGSVDGVMGSKTRAALKKFQENVNLPPKGKLDRLTIAALQIEEIPPKLPELYPPLLNIKDLDFKFTKNTKKITLNDKTLELSQNDTALSYAFSPDEKSLILGTRFYLYHYDTTGKIIWKKDAPEIVWAINIATNNKIFVAALNDGTLRWYKLADGSEILALYPHSDRHRWIAWTPSGAYTASVGADTLVGWHLNNKIGEASDFFPLRSLRTHYYQTSQTLKQNDDNITKFPKDFPPIVRLLSPKNGDEFKSEEVTLKYQYRFHGESAPVELRILVDGRPWKTIATKEMQREIKLHLPTRTIELALIAKTEAGTSPPEIIQLHWTGKTMPKASPKLYILVVGISDYLDKDFEKLPFATENFAAINKFYKESETKHLQNATSTEILEGFNWLKTNAKAKDITMIFLTGYALQDKKEGYHFLPADASMTTNHISTQTFITAFAGIQSKVLLCVDSAYTTNSEPADIDDFANQLSSPENGIIVLTSTAGAQQTEKNKSLFSTTLIEAFKHKGALSLQKLGNYVSNRVNKLSEGKQTPVLAVPETIANFTIKFPKK